MLEWCRKSPYFLPQRGLVKRLSSAYVYKSINQSIIEAAKLSFSGAFEILFPGICS